MAAVSAARLPPPEDHLQRRRVLPAEQEFEAFGAVLADPHAREVDCPCYGAFHTNITHLPRLFEHEREAVLAQRPLREHAPYVLGRGRLDGQDSGLLAAVAVEAAVRHDVLDRPTAGDHRPHRSTGPFLTGDHLHDYVGVVVPASTPTGGDEVLAAPVLTEVGFSDAGLLWRAGEFAASVDVDEHLPFGGGHESESALGEELVDPANHQLLCHFGSFFVGIAFIYYTINLNKLQAYRTLQLTQLQNVIKKSTVKT